MGREENIIVFEDTMKLCVENSRLKEAISKSLEKQRIVPEKAWILDKKKDIYTEPAQIVVSKKRSFEAAAGYKGYRTGVHNFASATNPGGGVVKGSGAQEECLCRCSGLYLCLNSGEPWHSFYLPHREAHNPLHNDDIIYTPDVVVFKSDTAYPELLPEEEWYEVNVITCAAPNLRSCPGNAYNVGDGSEPAAITEEELFRMHVKRLRRILDVALMKGNEVVILGAFGCGAFANNPEVVAKAAKEVLPEYLYAFRTVEFAVYCSSRDEENYRVFERVMHELENGG